MSKENTIESPKKRRDKKEMVHFLKMVIING